MPNTPNMPYQFRGAHGPACLAFYLYLPESSQDGPNQSDPEVLLKLEYIPSAPNTRFERRARWSLLQEAIVNAPNGRATTPSLFEITATLEQGVLHQTEGFVFFIIDDELSSLFIDDMHRAFPDAPEGHEQR